MVSCSTLAGGSLERVRKTLALFVYNIFQIVDEEKNNFTQTTGENSEFAKNCKRWTLR